MLRFLLLILLFAFPARAEVIDFQDHRIRDMSVSYDGTRLVAITIEIENKTAWPRVFIGSTDFDAPFSEITMPKGWLANTVDSAQDGHRLAFSLLCNDPEICGDRFKDWGIFEHDLRTGSFTELSGKIPTVIYQWPEYADDGRLYYTLNANCAGAPRKSYAICQSLIATAQDAEDLVVFPDEFYFNPESKLPNPRKGYIGIGAKSVNIYTADLVGILPDGTQVIRANYRKDFSCGSEPGLFVATSPRQRAFGCWVDAYEKDIATGERLTFVRPDEITLETDFQGSGRKLLRSPITDAEMFRDGQAMLVYQNFFGAEMAVVEGNRAELIVPENGYPGGRQSPYAVSISNSGDVLVFARGLKIGRSNADLSGIVVLRDLKQSELIRHITLR